MSIDLWYHEGADHRDFWAWSERVANDLEDRKARAEAALTLYFGAEFSFGGGELGSLASLIDLSRMRLEPIGYNLIASCTDTMAGHLLRNKVRPMFVTEKADSQQKIQALGMQRAVEGEFHAAGLYGDLRTDVCYRGLILDAGGIKLTPDITNNRIDVQLVWPHEFFVPLAEQRAGRAQQMVHCFDVDRAVLLAAFPEFEEQIRAAKPIVGRHNDVQGMVVDRVEIREAWHLPSGRVVEGEEHDGVRVLAIENCELVREPYAYDHFPVAWFRPMRAQGSYWSRGYPERLAGAQIKLNEYQDRIDRILHLHARPLLVTWDRAGLNRAKITNNVATILTSRVPPAQALWQMTPQAVPRELVERVQAIIAWGEKQAGISELSISAQKPAGIEHAPALRHLADTEAVRHTMVFSAWEQFHLDAAKIVVDCLRTLSEHNPNFETMFADNEELVRVKWREVDLSRDRYHLTCWPTNLLPQTPSARVALLGEMVDRGMISPKEAMSRFENPDVKDLLGDQTAALENVERVLQAAVEDKSDGSAVPHAYLDLNLLLSKAREKINRLESDGEDQEVIDRVIALFENAQKLALQMQAREGLASGAGGVAGIQAAAGQDMQAQAGVAPAAPGPAPTEPAI